MSTQPPENQPPENQVPENQPPENQVPENQPPENQVPENVPPEDQPVAPPPPGWSQAPPGHTPPPAHGGPLLPPEPPRGGGSIWPGVLIGVLVFALIAGGAFAVVRMRDGGDSGTASPSRAASTAPVEPGAMPSTDPALSAYYDAKLTWKKCGANQCADMTVPLDYAAPDAKTITIKVVKVPATGKRLGSMVVNPGGPGGSGIDYATGGANSWTEPLLQHYDIVGFDPRGVGTSTPLRCADTATLDRYVEEDPDPDTDAERKDYSANTKALGDGCLRESGDLVKHMSTLEVVKDMDVLRQLLGESKLTYFGASYGTTIGSQYANLFPTHVGRMVLDGAVDQVLDNEQINLGQAKGFETALRAYVQDCIDQGDCFLGATVDAGAAKIRAFIHEVERKPIPTRGDRELTAGTALYGVFLPLYVKDYWPYLTQGLESAMNDDNGTLLLTLADTYTSRGPNGYTDNSLVVLPAVNCLDDDEGIPINDVPAKFEEFLKASPTFGEVFAYSLSGCQDWPVHSKVTDRSVTAKGAPPIVVVGTTRDPATPYAWAVALSKELESGVLVSRDGDGHTGFNRGNTCVDGAVEGYLLSGKVPKDGLSC